ncbi:protein of unknown function (plasmid) [Azospirillum baldaniorum]|uniref:Uncharacterized protein n=1 Tax=Azospirillum baldaniorum TaxID=1064539 RepID=A0A9P1JW51_9PROT|nr:protein of unknown function [Azospirillum baldaniorum]
MPLNGAEFWKIVWRNEAKSGYFTVACKTPFMRIA